MFFVCSHKDKILAVYLNDCAFDVWVRYAIAICDYSIAYFECCHCVLLCFNDVYNITCSQNIARSENVRLYKSPSLTH